MADPPARPAVLQALGHTDRPVTRPALILSSHRHARRANETIGPRDWEEQAQGAPVDAIRLGSWDSTVMRRVYLDQAKWIDLGRAFHDRKGGEPFRDALEAGRQGASMGAVSFPLSLGHYIETWRDGNEERRARLAEAMTHLSLGHTMASPPQLCDSELDALLAEMANVEPARPARPVFGFGFKHAVGASFLPPGNDVEFEQKFLATRPPDFSEYGRGHRDFGDRYRDGEIQLASGARERSTSAAQTEAIIAASAVMEIHENIAHAAGRLGQSVDVLGPIGKLRPDLPPEHVPLALNEALPLAQPFIEHLPTRDAALQLRLLQHQNPQTRWESNDMVDVAYHACAIVHCDVVVTERQWVHMFQRSGLAQKHGTRVLHDVRELPQVLVDITS